jgi:hypothetical protein
LIPLLANDLKQESAVDIVPYRDGPCVSRSTKATSKNQGVFQRRLRSPPVSAAGEATASAPNPVALSSKRCQGVRLFSDNGIHDMAVSR